MIPYRCTTKVRQAQEARKINKMCKTSDKINSVVTAEALNMAEAYEAIDLMFQYKAMYETMMENLKDKYNDAMVKYMEDNNIKTLETEKGNRVTFVAESTKRVADTAKMKAEGVYDYYSKESVTKAHLQYTKAK